MSVDEHAELAAEALGGGDLLLGDLEHRALVEQAGEAVDASPAPRAGCTMRALESDTAMWLASTSSVRRTASPNAAAPARAEDERAERAVVDEQRQHHDRRHARRRDAAA